MKINLRQKFRWIHHVISCCNPSKLPCWAHNNATLMCGHTHCCTPVCVTSHHPRSSHGSGPHPWLKQDPSSTAWTVTGKALIWKSFFSNSLSEQRANTHICFYNYSCGLQTKLWWWNRNHRDAMVERTVNTLHISSSSFLQSAAAD